MTLLLAARADVGSSFELTACSDEFEVCHQLISLPVKEKNRIELWFDQPIFSIDQTYIVLHESLTRQLCIP